MFLFLLTPFALISAYYAIHSAVNPNSNAATYPRTTPNISIPAGSGNRAPVLTVPAYDLYWRYNQTYSTPITAVDPDRDGLKVVSVGIQPYPITGLSFSCQSPTNALTPTPAFTPGGRLTCLLQGTPRKNFNLTTPAYFEAWVNVTDDKGATAYKTFKIRFLN